MNKKQNWAIIIVFLVMIFGVAGVNLLKPTKEFSEKENRSLAQMPKLTLSAYLNGEFASDYESYVTDQFIGRDSWIGMKTAAERATGKQEINDIYFAEDGYLIEKHQGSYTTEIAKNNIGYLARFLEKSEEKYGAGHVSAMIVPNALNILADKLPAYASAEAEQEYLSEIKAALPDDIWFDTETLLNEHSGEYLYYKTDHHWTTLAAYYMYDSWAKDIGLASLNKEDYEIETVSENFKGTIEAKVGGKSAADSIQIFKPKAEMSYTVEYNESGEVQTSLYQTEALATKDQYTMFFGGNHPIVEIKVKNDSDRKLLVIKDSYAHCFVPFGFRDFFEITMIDIRYYNKSLQEHMEENEYTDVLFLNNVSGFAEDPNIAKLVN